MPSFQLRQPEAQLLYLATLYHLGRPGSEVDTLTRQPLAGGLAPVRAALDRQLALASSTLDVSDFQLGRLGEALLGLVNELKQIGISGRSVAPGLFEALARLYPEVTPEDPGAALDIAGEATMLRRRLDSAVRTAAAALEAARMEQASAAAVASGGRPKRWRFWNR